MRFYVNVQIFLRKNGANRWNHEHLFTNNTAKKYAIYYKNGSFEPPELYVYENMCPRPDYVYIFKLEGIKTVSYTHLTLPTTPYV